MSTVNLSRPNMMAMKILRVSVFAAVESPSQREKDFPQVLVPANQRLTREEQARGRAKSIRLLQPDLLIEVIDNLNWLMILVFLTKESNIAGFRSIIRSPGSMARPFFAWMAQSCCIHIDWVPT